MTASGYQSAIRLIEARSSPVASMHTDVFRLQDAELAIRTLVREIEGAESTHSCLLPDTDCGIPRGVE